MLTALPRIWTWFWEFMSQDNNRYFNCVSTFEISILDEGVCVSLRDNELGKRINSSVLPRPNMGRLGSFGNLFRRRTTLNSNQLDSVLQKKLTLLHILFAAKGLGKYIHSIHSLNFRILPKVFEISVQNRFPLDWKKGKICNKQKIKTSSFIYK